MFKIKRDINEREVLANATQVEPFTFCNERRLARVMRVVDGDTIEAALVVDGAARSFKVRLAGIDAPEMRPKQSDPNRDAIKREALAAKKHLETLLPRDCLALISCGQFDKFGRLLAERIVLDAQRDVDQKSVAETKHGGGNGDIIEQMVRDGYCVRVDDNKRAQDWDTMWGALQAQRQSRQRSVPSVAAPRKRKSCWLRAVCCCCCCWRC